MALSQKCRFFHNLFHFQPHCNCRNYWLKVVRINEGLKCLQSKMKLQKTHFIHTTSAMGEARHIAMPALSPTMTEGTIVRWLKKEGDEIVPGDVLCDIQTDKAVIGFELEEEGVLAKILADEGGGQVEIGKVIAVMVDDATELDSLDLSAITPQQDDVMKVAETQPLTEQAHPILPSGQYHAIGPAVRHLLHQYNVDMNQITPTGPRHSIILKHDVLEYVRSHQLKAPVTAQPLQPQPQVAPSAQPVIPSAQPVTTTVSDQFTDIPLTGMRRAIAKRLSLSKSSIPHAYASIDCCLEAVTKIRQQFKADGIKTSVNDFIIKAAATALQLVPAVNSEYDVSSGRVRQRPGVDISVAVATDSGLITPILYNAHTLGIQQISTQIRDLASRARAGKLQPAEYEGGSFTISNLGMYGISSFTAIINPPQCCILAVGGVRGEPVGELGECGVSTRRVLTLTLSYDRRAVDDSEASHFLRTLRGVVESPVRGMLLGPPGQQGASTTH